MRGSISTEECTENDKLKEKINTSGVQKAEDETSKGDPNSFERWNLQKPCSPLRLSNRKRSGISDSRRPQPAQTSSILYIDTHISVSIHSLSLPPSQDGYLFVLCLSLLWKQLSVEMERVREGGHLKGVHPVPEGDREGGVGGGEGHREQPVELTASASRARFCRFHLEPP